MDLEQLKQYIKEDTTGANYDTFRKQHPELNLLSSETLRKKFGGWKKLKELLGYQFALTTKKIKVYPIEDLKTMLIPHTNYLNGSRQQWDNYMQDKVDLPTSAALIRYYGNWNEMKKALNLSNKPNHRPAKYTKASIEQIYREYAPISFSPRKWNQYRTQNPQLNLPTSITIHNYLTKDEREAIKKELGLL